MLLPINKRITSKASYGIVLDNVNETNTTKP